MAKPAPEVMLGLKQPPQVVFHEPAPPRGNHVRLRLSPAVEIAVGARTKQAGEEMKGESVELLVSERPEQGQSGRMDAYERLVGDAMAGDATVFSPQDDDQAAWATGDPVTHGPRPMFDYEPGPWGAVQDDALVQEVGGWNTPE